MEHGACDQQDKGWLLGAHSSLRVWGAERRSRPSCQPHGLPLGALEGVLGLRAGTDAPPCPSSLAEAPR